MRKTKKRLVAAILCAVMLVGSAIAVSAAPYSIHTASCPRCRPTVTNTSYGYSENSSMITEGRISGSYCEGCGHVVPAGESHTYYWTRDRYFFRCSSCGYNYSVEFDNPPYYHQID